MNARNHQPSGPPYPHWRSNHPLREIMAKAKSNQLVNSEAVTTYAVGYACGTGNKGTYVRILVSSVKKGSSFSRFSLFGSEEILTRAGIDADKLQYPAKGDKEIRKAFSDANVVDMGQYVLWSVQHCPLKLSTDDDASVLLSVAGVSPEESAETDAREALIRRYSQAVLIRPMPDLLRAHKEFISADFVDFNEVFTALNNGSDWKSVLKELDE